MKNGVKSKVGFLNSIKNEKQPYLKFLWNQKILGNGKEEEIQNKFLNFKSHKQSVQFKILMDGDNNGNCLPLGRCCSNGQEKQQN